MIPSMATSTLPHPAGLSLPRIALGALATHQGWRWSHDQNPLDAVLHLTQARSAELPGVVDWWWTEVVLYNPEATAFLMTWLTLIAGIACTLGLFTRPAASVLACFGLHALVFGAPADRPLAVLVVAVALACALARAGWALGLDRAIDGNLPSWLTWVRGGSKSSPF